MSSEMIERVAAAILHELAPLHMDSVLSQGLSLKDRPCLPNGRAQQIARALIEVMREPTDGMMIGATERADAVVPVEELYWAYRNMITAALKE